MRIFSSGLRGGNFRAVFFQQANYGLRVALAGLLAFQPTMIEIANAQQVIVDPNAAVGFRPVLQQVGQTPVINVAAPNTGGVSHNLFSQFSVSPDGVVLNNAQSGAASQLVGSVAANPNLANGSAATILNEVTSASASSLTGALEVAGDRADVIIANPNGVGCDGCAFINTRDVTITTGAPSVSGADITLDVRQGAVTIGLGGLRGADQGVSTVNLVGREVNVGGKVTATDLVNVQGGAQTYDLDARARISQQPGVGAQPAYAVDGSAYGAMQANRITIIGNENGLGVRVPGALRAEASDIVVRSEGDVALRSAAAKRDLSVSAPQGSVVLERDISAITGDLRVDAGGDLTTTDRTGLYGADIALNSGGAIVFQGDAQADGGVSAQGRDVAFGGYATAGGGVSVVAGGTAQFNNATVAAASASARGAAVAIDNSALFLKDDFTVNAGNFRLGAKTVVDGLTDADTPALVVDADGNFVNAADLRNFDAPRIAYDGDLINEAGGVISEEALRLNMQGDVHNAGVLQGEQSLSFNIGALDNQESGVIIAPAISINARDDVSNKGVIASDGALTLQSQTEIFNDGYVRAARATLSAPTITNADNGEIKTETSVLLNASGAARNTGVVTSLGAAELRGATVENAGLAMADGVLTLRGAESVVNAETLVAGRRVQAISDGGIVNTGEIASYDDLFLNAQGVVSNAGNLLADDYIGVSGLRFDNNAGGLVRAKRASLTPAALYNRGQLYFVDSFSHSGLESFYNDGVLASAGSVSLIGANEDAVIGLGANSVIAAGLNPDDETQTLNSGASVYVSFNRIGVNGQVAAGGNVSVRALTALDVAGVARAGGNLYLQGPTVSIGAEAKLTADGFGYVNAPTLFSNAGAVDLGRHLSVAKGVDFHNSGTIVADYGDSIALEGLFYNTGVFAMRNQAAVVADRIVNAGHMQTGGDLYLNAADSLFQSGSSSVGGTATLRAEQITFAPDAYMSAARMLAYADTFNQGGAISLTGDAYNYWNVSGALAHGGRTYSKADLTAIAGSVWTGANSFLGTGGAMLLRSANSISLSGAITSGDARLEAAGGLYAAADSSILANGDVRLFADRANLYGEIAAGDDLTLRAAQSFDLRGKAFGARVDLESVEGSAYLRGDLYASDRAAIRTAGWVYNYGFSEAANSLSVDAGYVYNAAAGVFSATDLTVKGRTGVNNYGRLAGASAVTVATDAGFINRPGAQIDGVSFGLQAEDFSNYGDVDVYGLFAEVNDLVYNAGTLRARTYLGLNAGRLSNVSQILSSGAVAATLNGALLNGADARIAGDTVDLRSRGYIGNAGVIDAARAVNLATTGDIRNNGSIGAAATDSLSIAARHLTNTGALYANDLRAVASGNIYNDESGRVYAVDLLGLQADGAISNYGHLLSQGFTNLVSVDDRVLNYSAGIVYGDTIAIHSKSYTSNAGRIGRTGGTSAYNAELVNIEAEGGLGNSGVVASRNIRLLSSQAGVTNAYSGQILALDGLFIGAERGGITNSGVIRAANASLSAGRNVLNQGALIASSALSIGADGWFINRNLDRGGDIRATTVAIASGDGLTNDARLQGYESINLESARSWVVNNGALIAPDLTMIADNGRVKTTTAISAGGGVNARAHTIELLAWIHARDTINLKSTVGDIIVRAPMIAPNVYADAAANIRADAYAFRGAERTQLVANDILRNDGRDDSAKLGVIYGARKDIYVQLRTGDFGAERTDYVRKAPVVGPALQPTSAPLQYIASYPDLIRAYGANGWWGAYHYNVYGAREGRQVSFDGLAYIATYGDLVRAFGANAERGAQHYIQYGLREGRSVQFNAEQYLRNYADLRAAFGYDLYRATLHYITNGYAEGRTWRAAGSQLDQASWDRFRSNPVTTVVSEAVNWNVSGSVSLIADSGDMRLGGAIRAADDVYLSAGGQTRLSGFSAYAGDVLHVQGDTLARVGGVSLTAGNKLQLVSESGDIATADWLRARDLPFGVAIQARNIDVNSDHRILNGKEFYLQAARAITQTDHVISAHTISYKAGTDIKVDFDPFAWRAANRGAASTGDAWNIPDAGLYGRTLMAGAGGLTLLANRDIILTSGKLYSAGDISLAARRNIISNPLYRVTTRADVPDYVGWSFADKYRNAGNWRPAAGDLVDGRITGDRGLAETVRGDQLGKIKEQRAYENQIYARGDVSLYAGNTVNLVGTRIESGLKSVFIQGLNGVNLAAASGYREYQDSWTRTSGSWFWKKRESWGIYQYDDIYKAPVIRATRGDVSLISEGDVLSAGAQITAGGDITVGSAGRDVLLGAYAERYVRTGKYKKTGSLFGIFELTSSSTQVSVQATVNTGNNFRADSQLTLRATRDLRLIAGQYQAQRVLLAAGRNLYIDGAINSLNASSFVQRNNGITITTITDGFETEAALMPQITSTDRPAFEVGGEVHIAGWRGANLNDSLLATIESGQFEQALANLFTPQEAAQAAAAADDVSGRYTRAFDLPGASDGQQYAYLDTLLNDYGATYHTIELRDHQWYDKQVQMAPAAMALISAVATFITAGAGGVLGAGLGASLTSNAALAGAINATAANFGANLVAGAITGNIDMGAILQGAVLAGVTSYATSFISAHVNLGTRMGLSGDPLAFGFDRLSPEALVNNFGNRVVSTAVNNVLRGEDVFAGFDDLGRSFVFSETMALAQFGIGNLGAGNNDWEGSVPHLLLHGGVGCLYSVAMDGNCAAGFASGAAQSVLSGSSLTDDQKARLVDLVGAIAAFPFADGNAANVTNGQAVSSSGLENNYLKHTDVAQMSADLAACRAKETGCSSAEQQEIALRYIRVSLENDRTLADTCFTTACIDAFLADAATYDDIMRALRGSSTAARYMSVSGAWGVNDQAWRQLSVNVDYVNGYRDYQAARCGGMSDAACIEAYGVAYAGYLSDIHAVETAKVIIALATVGVAIGVEVGPAALLAARQCMGNPVCWNELAIAAGEIAAGDALGGAALTMTVATGGRLVLQKGDEIVGLLDDAGRMFAPTGQMDDLGRMIFTEGTGASYVLTHEGDLIAGSLRVTAANPSASERAAAEYLASQGRTVILRDPVGTRAGGGTSDLLVDGVNYDVYTPTTANPSRIISAISKKNDQATGIVLDLSMTTVTLEELGDVLMRVNGTGATNITDIVIIGR